MPDFQPLTPAQTSLILETHAPDCRFCDKTPGNLAMWAHQLDTHFACVCGCLLLRSRWDGRLVYSAPAGTGDFSAALDAAAADARALGESLAFASLTAGETDRIAAHFGGSERITDDGWYDYLYAAEPLTTLAGRAYHGPRNHVNRFCATYPNYSYSPLTLTDLDAVCEFFARQRVAADDGTASAAAEADAAADMLALYPALLDAGAPLCGGVLRVGGEIAGFSIGEVVDDTLYVHIEKGNTAFTGVYPMLVREFVRMAGGGVGFINREEDDGNPGLRRSKLAYRPVAQLEKFMLLCPDAR